MQLSSISAFPVQVTSDEIDHYIKPLPFTIRELSNMQKSNGRMKRYMALMACLFTEISDRIFSCKVLLTVH